MELGDIISNYISESNISLRDFAARANISPSMISYYINGRNGRAVSVTDTNLKKIAKAMNMSFFELCFSLDGNVNIKFGDSDGEKLLAIYNRLDEEARIKLIDYAEYLEYSGKKS